MELDLTYISAAQLISLQAALLLCLRVAYPSLGPGDVVAELESQRRLSSSRQVVRVIIVQTASSGINAGSAVAWALSKFQDGSLRQIDGLAVTHVDREMGEWS